MNRRKREEEEGEKEKKKKKGKSSPAGFEPATSGLEVQRAIHCATGTYAKRTSNSFYILRVSVVPEWSGIISRLAQHLVTVIQTVS